MKELAKMFSGVLVIIAFFIFGIQLKGLKIPKRDIEKRAEKIYLKRLEEAYIFKTKALRKYMPIAIDKNASKNKKEL